LTAAARTRSYPNGRDAQSVRKEGCELIRDALEHHREAARLLEGEGVVEEGQRGLDAFALGFHTA